MISFTCLPLVFHLFPLVSHSGSGWSHDFLHLSPICLSFVFHLSPTLGPVGRMISFTCLPFVFHLSPACSPNRFTCMGFLLLRKVACLGRMILTVSPGLRPQSVGSGWSHDFLHLSFICLPLVSHSGSGWWHDFPSLSPFCLSFVSHSGSAWWHDFPSLSPTLGRVGRMISFTCLPFVCHLSSTCLPLWVRLVA